MNNSTGIIITLAYPETVVRLAKEWYSPLLRFFGLGKKGYIRAGHAALVLIDKKTGALDYYDFGRYITPQTYGRVRSKRTDAELNFPLKAEISKTGMLKNSTAILKFLATNPSLTHGEGNMFASITNSVDYDLAKNYINTLQDKQLIRYGAFIKTATNCARFVTDTIIAAVHNDNIKTNLIKSNKFTPSTIGNVILASDIDQLFEVDVNGVVKSFSPPKKWSNIKYNVSYFIDSLKQYTPTTEGTLVAPIDNNLVLPHAQWLGGIGSGAWFELYKTQKHDEYRVRRISPNRIDVDAIFKIDNPNFDYNTAYHFDYPSNCYRCVIVQNGTVYNLSFVKAYSLVLCKQYA